MLQNAQIKNIIKLSSKITVYVPSTININQTIDNTEYVNKTATLLSECFGGATSTNTLGYWVSATEGLVTEKSTMVFSYCTDVQLNENIEKIMQWVNTMRVELSQDAIAVEVNGEMWLV
jgi:hypothetical protein